MTNITKLLDKYETPDGENKRVYGEVTTDKYRNTERQKANLKNRHLLLDNILNETEQPINKQQKTEIKQWINQFHDEWKTIHRQSSDETIITALILIQYKKNNYRIPKALAEAINKYDLTTRKFLLIQNRIIFLLMKYTPLNYTLEERYRQYQEISQ